MIMMFKLMSSFPQFMDSITQLGFWDIRSPTIKTNVLRVVKGCKELPSRDWTSNLEVEMFF